MAGSEECRWATLKDGRVTLEEASGAVQTVLRVHEDALQKTQAEGERLRAEKERLQEKYNKLESGFWSVAGDRDGLKLQLAGQMEIVTGLRAALSSLIKMIESAHKGCCGDHCVYSPQISERSLEKAREALGSVAPLPGTPEYDQLREVFGGEAAPPELTPEEDAADLALARRARWGLPPEAAPQSPPSGCLRGTMGGCKIKLDGERIVFDEGAGPELAKTYRFHLARHDEASAEFEFESMAKANEAIEDWVKNITEYWMEEVSGG